MSRRPLVLVAIASVALTGLGVADPHGAKSGESEKFVPQSMEKLKNDEFGEVVRFGEAIFHDTRANASRYVGNDLACRNCHLDDGKLGTSAPIWAAYLVYPQYRKKDREVNTFGIRLQGCFRYSMNGAAPPLDDKVIVALESYAFYLATGGPTGVALPQEGYPKLSPPPAFDRSHGKAVFLEKCALCHGADGDGQKAKSGETVFPPLWGARSYNWGAGMSSVNNAASFIKANMPLSQGGTLSNADAWDVAYFIDSQERPQDPRYTGSVAETRKQFHDSAMDLYGEEIDGRLLGAGSQLSATVPRD